MTGVCRLCPICYKVPPPGWEWQTDDGGKADIGQTTEIKSTETPKKEEEESENEDGDELEMLALLFKLQMETMHGLVKTVYVRNSDRPSEVQFLYLTNKQAMSVPQQNMHKVCEELHLGKPALVIRLMPCQLGNDWWKAFPYFASRFPEKRTPETPEEEEMTEHQLLLLAKEVILPLCNSGVQTLVVGQAACSLTAAFLQVCSQIQSQYQGLDRPCPFRVLMLGRAPFFELKARQDTSMVANFKRASKRWSQKTDAFTKALDRRYGNDEAYWPRLELYQGQYSVIMFECLGADGALNEKAMMGFQHDLLTALMEDVSVLGIQTYGTERMSFMPAVADHVGRGMPLMLIDSRRRTNCAVANVEEAEAELKQLSVKLHAAGVADWYCTSALALVKSAIDNRRKELDQGEKALVEQEQMWIYQAILTARKELARKKKENQKEGEVVINTNAKKKKKGKNDNSSDALEDSDVVDEKQLVKGTNILMSYVGSEIEWEMLERHARFKEGMAKIEQAATWPAFRDEVEANWLKIRGCAFHLHKGMDAFVSKHPWCEKYDEGANPVPGWRMGRQRLKVNLSLVPCPQDKAFFQESKAALLKLFQGEFDISGSMDKNRLTTRAFISQDELWMSVYETLRSGDVATGSLHDLEDCRRKLAQLADLDYLPSENSLEALVLLRRAWTLYELYTSNGMKYRIYAKIAYAILLFLEVLITVIVTSRNFFDEDEDSLNEWLSLLIFHPRILMALALLSSLVSGFQALMSPNRKAVRLRSAAFKMESEIWKFRARMGEYRLKDAALIGVLQADRENEAAFSANLMAIEEAVRTSAGMGRTHFYSKTTTVPDTMTNPEFDTKESAIKKVLDRFVLCKHNQYPTGQRRPKRGADNHHSPIKPDSYVAMRIFPARDLVQSSIPKNVRAHFFFQAILILSTTVTALLAATTDGTLNAMIASLTGAVAAWQEFSGVEKRLDKFSEVAEKLDQLVMWWQALPDEEKRAVKNAETLVLEAENEICNQVPAMTNATSVQAQKKD